MIPTVRFKLTTSQPIERFTNLSPAVYAHTVVIWDGNEASFYCEKHDVYFREKECCPQCNPERQPGSKKRSRQFSKVCEIAIHLIERSNEVRTMIMAAWAQKRAFDCTNIK